MNNSTPTIANRDAGQSLGPDDDQGPHGAPSMLDALLAGLDLTDVGNAERLVARHGHDLRYNQAEKRWYI